MIFSFAVEFFEMCFFKEVRHGVFIVLLDLESAAQRRRAEFLQIEIRLPHPHQTGPVVDCAVRDLDSDEPSSRRILGRAVEPPALHRRAVVAQLVDRAAEILAEVQRSQAGPKV